MAKAIDPAMMAAFERCGEALMVGMTERTKELSTRQEGTSQLAYALSAHLLQEERPEPTSVVDATRLMAEQRRTTMRAFARASEMDPSHPDIGWLAAERCFDGAECKGVQQALLKTEPENLAVLLRAMAWARSRGDEAGMDVAFQRAASATHYDTHRDSSLLAIMDRYADLPIPAVCNDSRLQAAARKRLPGGQGSSVGTLVEFVGVASEQMKPMLPMNVSDFCQAEDGGALAPDRQAGCVQILTAIADGDSVVEQTFAASQLIGLNGGRFAHSQPRATARRLVT